MKTVQYPKLKLADDNFMPEPPVEITLAYWYVLDQDHYTIKIKDGSGALEPVTVVINAETMQDSPLASIIFLLEHHFEPYVKKYSNSITLIRSFANTHLSGVAGTNPWLSADDLINIKPSLVKSHKHPSINKLPGRGVGVKNPVTGNRQELHNCIIYLNDQEKWTREKIADWLETLDVDLRFSPVDTGGSDVYAEEQAKKYAALLNEGTITPLHYKQLMEEL